jgi:hypothetical protein
MAGHAALGACGGFIQTFRVSVHNHCRSPRSQSITYSITLSASELNLIDAALHRLPPEQIVLIESLRRQGH